MSEQQAPSAPPDPAATPAATTPPVPTPGEVAAATTGPGTPVADTVEDLQKKLAAYQEIASKQEQRAKENAEKAQQFDALTAASQTELERTQAEAQRLAQRADLFRGRAVTGEAKALAVEFANPEVAVRLLGDLQGYVDDDSGEIDTTRLKSDLDSLLTREPYLARVQAPAGMRPNPAQGQSGAPALSPSQRAQEASRTGDWKAAGAAKADVLLQMRDQK